MAAAYVASARIDRGRPRLIATPASIAAPAGDARRAATVEGRLVDTTPPEQRGLELRLEAVRERWSQLWFFVLDRESWR
jgi:hypothetical protein